MKEELTAEDFAIVLTRIIYGNVCDDWAWHCFGFKRRPKRGAFFDRFIDPEVLAEERFLKQELLVVTLTKVGQSLLSLLSAHMGIAVYARVLELSVDGLRSKGERVWHSFSFLSREAALRIISDGIKSYSDADTSQSIALFGKRMTAVVRQQHRALWLVGATKLFVSGQSPIPNIYQPLSDFLQERELVGKVLLRDHDYLELAQVMLNYR